VTSYPAGFLPWCGDFLAVDVDRVVSWARCVVCGAKLSTERARAAGIGPDCERRISAARRGQLVDTATRMERERFAQDLAAAYRWAILKRASRTRPPVTLPARAQKRPSGAR
jgi:diacylglycerol kinase family enzyme